MSRRVLAGFVAAGAVASLMFASSVDAQNKKRKRAPKVIQLEEIKIEGRVQKPNAFYILNRSSIGYEIHDLRTSFVNKVARSVQREPF